MIAATTSAAIESPSLKPAFAASRPRAPRSSRPCRRRSAARWSAAPGCRSAARRRSETLVRLRSTTSATPITANWYQRISGALVPLIRCLIGFDADEQRAADQDRRLAERAEVLGAAMAVGVAPVGRAPAEAHREERQHGGDHVAAGLDAGRDQPEAVRGQADAELQRHEQRGGGDRDERRPPHPGTALRCVAAPASRETKAAAPEVNAVGVAAPAVSRPRLPYRGAVAHDHGAHSHGHAASRPTSRACAWRWG